MTAGIVLAYILAALAMLVFFRMVRIVPEQEAWIVEQFGKFRRTLGSGLHVVVPVAQRIAYRHLLKEEVIDVEPQICITNDNVQVTVDGILYLKVIDPVKASYGIESYRYATAQLAKTTMRSEIGKLVLDRTFSERDALNDAIVRAVDEARAVRGEEDDDCRHLLGRADSAERRPLEPPIPQQASEHRKRGHRHRDAEK